MAVGLYAYLAWTRLQFFYDDDGDLRITSGLLVRNERRVQLSRLQLVDVPQPLLARRLLGSQSSSRRSGLVG